MEQVRFGVIGLGNMGTAHSRYLNNGEVPGAKITAICEGRKERLDWARNNLASDIQLFEDLDAMLNSDVIDAVIVATPHFAHPELAIKVLEKGLHVLVEKPAGVFTKNVREMNEVAAKIDKVFGIMFNERTIPAYQKVKDLVDKGELGEIKRVHWTITTHYRPQSYYNSGSWRGTWGGEGGGVLLNQCPHQIDLMQWICGVPTKIRAFCSFGKYHDIEVEDDVTAYMEYANGATGVFIASTGEAPGTDRLEIVGNQGKIVIEDGKITFWRLEISERDFNAGTRGGFSTPQVWKCDIPASYVGTDHKGITKNFVDAILLGEPLLSPGEDGINSLEMSNAMHLSAWTDDWVSIPVDEELYLEKLSKLQKDSVFWTRENKSVTLDVNDSLKKK